MLEAFIIHQGISQEKIEAWKATPVKTDVKPVEESEDKPQPLLKDPKEGNEDHKDDDDEDDPAPSNTAL